MNVSESSKKLVLNILSQCGSSGEFMQRVKSLTIPEDEMLSILAHLCFHLYSKESSNGQYRNEIHEMLMKIRQYPLKDDFVFVSGLLKIMDAQETFQLNELEVVLMRAKVIYYARKHGLVIRNSDLMEMLKGVGNVESRCPFAKKKFDQVAIDDSLLKDTSPIVTILRSNSSLDEQSKIVIFEGEWNDNTNFEQWLRRSSFAESHCFCSDQWKLSSNETVRIADLIKKGIFIGMIPRQVYGKIINTFADIFIKFYLFSASEEEKKSIERVLLRIFLDNIQYPGPTSF